MGQECGDFGGVEGIRGQSGNGKNVIKIIYLKKTMECHSSVLKQKLNTLSAYIRSQVSNK